MNKTLTKEELIEIIKKELPNLIGTESAIRYEILKVVKEEHDKELHIIWEEIKNINLRIEQLRVDFNKRFDEVDKKFDKVDKRFDEVDKKFEIMDKKIDGVVVELKQEIKDTNEGLEKKILDTSKGLEKKILDSVNAIGSRWGIFVEEVFRNTIKGLLEKKFNVRVQERKIGKYQVDIIIENGQPIILEITSSTSEKDIDKLIELKELYKKETGIEPDIALTTAYIPFRFHDKLVQNKIEVFAYDGGTGILERIEE